MTAAEFIANYPSFASTSDELITAKLGLAAQRVDPVIWGSRYNAGLAALAAHLLWTDPFGTTTRLDGGGDAKTSRYLEEFRAMVRELGIPRFMVL